MDPGCGTAILSCSLIEHLVDSSTAVKCIELDLYDTDTVLMPYTEIVLSYLNDWLHSKGIQIDSTIHQEDFIIVNHTYIHTFQALIFSTTMLICTIISYQTLRISSWRKMMQELNAVQALLTVRQISMHCLWPSVQRC